MWQLYLKLYSEVMKQKNSSQTFCVPLTLVWLGDEGTCKRREITSKLAANRDELEDLSFAIGAS